MRSNLRGFLIDERGGDRGTLTTLLILALVILPLILALLFFGEQVKEFAEGCWNYVVGEGF